MHFLILTLLSPPIFLFLELRFFFYLSIHFLGLAVVVELLHRLLDSVRVGCLGKLEELEDLVDVRLDLDELHRCVWVVSTLCSLFIYECSDVGDLPRHLL